MPPGSPASAPQPQSPSMMQLSGVQGSSQPPGGDQTAGMSQISTSAVRMGSEIDQALKLLAQALPQLAPWVEKTTMELQYQLGTALQSGNVPTSPTPQGNSQMPDGLGRL